MTSLIILLSLCGVALVFCACMACYYNGILKGLDRLSAFCDLNRDLINHLEQSNELNSKLNDELKLALERNKDILRLAENCLGLAKSRPVSKRKCRPWPLFTTKPSLKNRN